MNLIKVFCCIFILSLLPSVGNTQQQKLAYNFNSYNSEIPTTTIYPIVNDKMGNLWMATNKGVVKFDGTNFTTINIKSGLLYNEIIYLLYQPDENTLWAFSYYSKVIKINMLNNSFAVIKQPDINIGPLFYAYFSDKNLQILSQRYQLSLVNNKFIKRAHQYDAFEKYLLKFPNKISNLNINLFKEVKRSSIYNNDLNVSNKTRLGKYHTLLFKMGIYFSENNKIYQLLNLKELQDEDNTSIVDIEFIKNDIYIAINGKNGGIFYGKDFLENPTTSKLYRVSAVGAANSITKDSLGNIWYSLDGLGLFVINQLRLNATFLPLNGLDNKNLIEVVNDDYLLIKNKKTVETKLLSLNKQNTKIPEEANSAILNYKRLVKIPSTRETKDISHDNSFLFKRMEAISKKNAIYLNYPTSPTSTIKCADNFKTQLIFYATNDSIYLYQDKIKKQTSYPQMGSVNDIYFANEGLVIFCADNGVFTSDTNLKTFKEISKKRFTKALVDNNIIYFINDEELAYINFKKNNDTKGLFSNKYYLGSFKILDFGISLNKIHLLTDAGYIGLDKSIVNMPKQPIIFNLNSIELQNDTLYQIKAKMSIAPLSANRLKFNFNFLNPENKNFQKSYSFTAEDEQSNWINFTENNFTQTNIAPGNYILKIKAKFTETGQEKIISYKIHIKPKFYQTTWFYSICIFIIICVIVITTWLVYDKFQKKKLSKLQLDSKINELEHAAFLNQLNPHFLYNALNKLQNYIIKKDVHNGIEYLNRVTSLHRNILAFSQKKYITIAEEQTFLEKYLFVQQKRYNDKFNFKINIEGAIQNMLIPPMLLQPILENAIEHGFSGASETKQITVNFKKDTFLQITIADDGKGELTQLSNLKKGHALHIIEERLDFMNQKTKTNNNKISFSANTPKGIIIHLTIDLQS